MFRCDQIGLANFAQNQIRGLFMALSRLIQIKHLHIPPSCCWFPDIFSQLKDVS